MHRARDSRGRFLARAKSSIFTSPSTSRERQETSSSPTHTPSPRVSGIPEAVVDSPSPSIESELGRDPFLLSSGGPIIIEEVETPEEEEGGISPRSPFVEEPEDLETFRGTIMTEERTNGLGRGGRGGGRGNNGGGRGNIGGNAEGDNSFGFPIVDEESRATMKNISSSVLPNFHGERNEDPETFLFEFEVVCRTYDYLEDSQKLKLFPSTLKGAALKWFMGLVPQSIRTWNDMKQTFLDRYLDYCMPTNHKDEVFKMVQREDENLEEILERFQYNLKRAKMSNVDQETLKALLLKAIRDEWIDILNMMGKGDISQLSLNDIADLCIHLSRGKSKTKTGPRDPSLIRANKSATGSVSRAEIGNMLDEFKTDILGSLSEQLDTLKIHNKQKAEAEALAIFCPKCRKKHALRECPLDAKVVDTCVICSENHETKDCPSIPGLKTVFQEDPNTLESLCFVAR